MTETARYRKGDRVVVLCDGEVTDTATVMECVRGPLGSVDASTYEGSEPDDGQFYWVALDSEPSHGSESWVLAGEVDLRGVSWSADDREVVREYQLSDHDVLEVVTALRYMRDRVYPVGSVAHERTVKIERYIEHERRSGPFEVLLRGEYDG